MANFEATVTVSSDLDVVFDFLVRPANVLAISPPEADLSFIDAPDLLELGSRIEFQLGGFGLPQRFLHEIIRFERPTCFTEKLVEGPLKHYLHEHVVETAGPNQVLVIDRIEFEPPGGLVGFLVTEQMILESMKTAFEHRHRELKKLLERS